MIFKTLKDKCEYFRDLGERRLAPNGYVVMMLDGRSFSKFIKNTFKKPFDHKFMDMMNKTAEYLCANISGAKVAYVQSDEISLILHDTSETEPFFALRVSKLLSIGASLATAKFNRLLDEWWRSEDCTEIRECPLIQFDCKVWNVNNCNDAYAWLLYRQHDCVRNSKQQAAQTWLSHKQLEYLNTDQQVMLLKETNGIDWNDFSDSEKYGRFIIKTYSPMYTPQGERIYRHIWKQFSASPLDMPDVKKIITDHIDGIEEQPEEN